jgi:hypothetical protein
LFIVIFDKKKVDQTVDDKVDEITSLEKTMKFETLIDKNKLNRKARAFAQLPTTQRAM